MATHVVCHSTEPLPHVYPAGISQQTHGAVSQYEVLNTAKKAHSEFPPPGWDFSQTSEEDSLPLVQPKPRPANADLFFQPDPTLCITPERPKPWSSARVNQIPDLDPDPLLCITPEKSAFNPPQDEQKKSKQRVRFDVEDSFEDITSKTDSTGTRTGFGKDMKDKQYKPELYGSSKCDDEDSAKSSGKVGSRTVQYTLKNVNNNTVYVPLYADGADLDPEATPQPLQSLSQGSKTEAVKQKTVVQASAIPNSVTVVRENPSKVSTEDPIAACRSHSDKNVPKRKVKVFREEQYGPTPTDYTYPYGLESQDLMGGEEHMFARPEYNSTLRMKQAAEKLKESSIDVAHALQKKLNVSEATRNEINEKAASMVNAGSSTYQGLVSLEVPVDQLVTRAAETKYSQSKSKKSQKPKPDREPDLMEFFTPELVKESVTFNLSGVPAPSQSLSTASQWRAFDLYRHNRVWEDRV